jgi:hypothetical protein
MSEPIWCDVHIVCPASWGDDPSKILGVDMLADALINGYVDCAPIEGTDRMRWDVNGEGNYGLGDSDVENALSWLEDHGVPYRASSDPKYEYLGEVRVFDGHNTVEDRPGGPDSQVVLDEYTFKAIVIKWEHAPAGALQAITEHFTLPDIYEIDISHLPATAPTEDDEDDVEEGAMIP